jgi:hypothetical protein
MADAVAAARNSVRRKLEGFAQERHDGVKLAGRTNKRDVRDATTALPALHKTAILCFALEMNYDTQRVASHR